MLQEAWEGTTGLLERRFLTNAFLPVLLFSPAVAVTGLAGTGRLAAVLSAGGQLETGAKVVLLAGYLLAVWFLASFVQSQWRNLVRLFEGYPLGRWRSAGDAGREWHRARVDRLRQGAGPAHDLYYRYPASDSQVMPTRLGNVLRSAERYGWERYRADTIVLWPRLAPLVPPEFAARVDEFRGALEFLLVVSVWSGAYALVAGAWLVVADGNLLLFLACSAVGYGVAYAAYLSALEAAVEYGEQLRVGVDLFRTRVLGQLRLPLPNDLQEERRQWQLLDDFVSSNYVEALTWVPGAPPAAG